MAALCPKQREEKGETYGKSIQNTFIHCHLKIFPSSQKKTKYACEILRALYSSLGLNELMLIHVRLVLLDLVIRSEPDVHVVMLYQER